MKALKLFILMLLTAFATYAQKPTSFTVDLKKGITLIDSAKTADQYAQAATYFDKMAITQPKEWLVQYYSAYSNLLMGIRGTGNEEMKDAIYNKALGYVAKADALQPNNSEIYVLKGYLTFMKMSIESQTRAMQMIPEADEYLVKAIKLNPENPRAYLVRGQNTFYTPQMFGGGKKEAKPILAAGVEKFAIQNIKGLEPAWGKARCATLLKQCD
ncbi:hypothetical protein ACFQ3S_05900 [Mucilaginibacter terrae]|uniref:hypothetical protein n=1 Tax=Mucilaginibacter terrae TaxID=1955052 RepID=UPI003632FF89